MTEQNYFVDKNGNAIRVYDRISTPTGDKTVLGLNYNGDDCFPVVKIGTAEWQRCEDVEIIWSPSAELASPAEDAGLLQPITLKRRTPEEEQRYLMAAMQAVAMDSQGNIKALESRLGELADRVEGDEHKASFRELFSAVNEINRTRGIAADSIDARVSALEINCRSEDAMGEGRKLIMSRLVDRVSALESWSSEMGPPYPNSLAPDTPEAADASLSRDHPRPEFKVDPILSDAVGDVPEDWDLSRDRCRECHAPWDEFHRLRGSCPALVKPQDLTAQQPERQGRYREGEERWSNCRHCGLPQTAHGGMGICPNLGAAK